MSAATSVRRLPRLGYNAQYLSVLATGALLVVFFVLGAIRYDSFGTVQVAVNILIDQSYLLVIGIGMTFVILTGGIDLSVGAMVALSSMISGVLLTNHAIPAIVVVPVVLGVGLGFGWVMGAIIHYFRIQPFIVTLAGLFVFRGLAHVMSENSISITDPFYTWMARTRIPFVGGATLTPSVLVGLATLVIAAVVLHYTRFGRTVYAIGGSEQSAMLMGLDVARTTVGVYMISGFCSALGGLLYTFYISSGYSLHATGLELDAIAAVVIGGTLLTGGTGYVLGTLFGVCLLGVIETLINFQGTLSSWWTKIAIGALLLLFILFQRATVARR